MALARPGPSKTGQVRLNWLSTKRGGGANYDRGTSQGVLIPGEAPSTARQPVGPQNQPSAQGSG